MRGVRSSSIVLLATYNFRNILKHKIHLFLHSIYLFIYLLHFSRIKNTLPQIFNKILSTFMVNKYFKKQIVFDDTMFVTQLGKYKWVEWGGVGKGSLPLGCLLYFPPPLQPCLYFRGGFWSGLRVINGVYILSLFPKLISVWLKFLHKDIH